MPLLLWAAEPRNMATVHALVELVNIGGNADGIAGPSDVTCIGIADGMFDSAGMCIRPRPVTT